LWRRFFQWKDEQELEQIEAIHEALREYDELQGCPNNPIRSDRAKAAMTQFMRETSRYAAQQSVFRNPTVQAARQAQETPRQVRQVQAAREIEHPDLRVNSMFLAQ
jgi:hypothetical protein